MTQTVVEACLDELTAETLLRGAPFRTRGRTVTEADIINFAGVTGDWNPQHCNEVWAAQHSPFGTRIAHGLLALTITAGPIQSRLPSADSIVEARVGFKRAVRIGETVVAHGRVRNAGRDRYDVSATIDVAGEVTARIKLTFSTGRPPDNVPVMPLPAEPDPVEQLGRAQLDAGRPYRSRGRLVGDADVTAFNALSGDWTPRTGRDARGADERHQIPALLLAAIAAAQVPLDLDRMIAARRSTVRFAAPVLAGDTVHSEGCRGTARELTEGVIEHEWDWRVRDQGGRVAAQMLTSMIMKST